MTVMAADVAVDQLRLGNEFCRADYVILLCRFDWDAEELAEHLRIVEQTLLARLRWFGAWTRWQASLFDGLQTIALDFEPTKARSLASRLHEATASIDPQLAWNFAAPPGQHS